MDSEISVGFLRHNHKISCNYDALRVKDQISIWNMKNQIILSGNLVLKSRLRESATEQTKLCGA